MYKLNRMKAYSNDLRKKIVEAYERDGETQEEIAERFSVSPATVKNYIRRKRETGSSDALPRGGGRQLKLQEEGQQKIRQLLSDRNDMTLRELCLGVEEVIGESISQSAMCRLLQKLNLGRKKKSLRE